MRTETTPEPTRYLLDRGTVETVSTSEDARDASAVSCRYRGSMQLLARDVEIIKLVSRFGQLTGGQIDALVFANSKAERPSRRAIRRLVQSNMLALVPGSAPGGVRGGRPENVYQVGAEGWRTFWSGRYKPTRAINAHTLAIADTFVLTRKAEGEGWLKVRAYATEPDSHVQIEGVIVRPDLYVDVENHASGYREAYFIEVDLGTERQKQILAKVRDYVYAFNHRDKSPLQLVPRVVFLAIDEERKLEINEMLRRAGELPQGLFRVAMLGEFPAMIRT